MCDALYYHIRNRIFKKYSTSVLFNEVFWRMDGMTDQLLWII